MVCTDTARIVNEMGAKLAAGKFQELGVSRKVGLNLLEHYYSELANTMDNGQQTRSSDTLEAGPHAMQVFHETVQFTDPPLPPEEPTPSQRLFHAYLSGGRPELDREYQRVLRPIPSG